MVPRASARCLPSGEGAKLKIRPFYVSNLTDDVHPQTTIPLLYQIMLRVIRAAQLLVSSITWALNRSGPPWLQGA
jgi:hypothetical protein